jgi:predicted MFS family arabinose efflux permease
VDAVSFAGAALAVGLGVRVGGHGERTAVDGHVAAAPEPYLDALRAGARFLRRDPLIGALMLMVLASNFFDQANGVVFIPVWAHDRVGSATAMAVVFGAMGVGAVLGNLVFTALAPRLPRYWTFTIGFLLGGGWPYVALGLSRSVAVVGSVAFVSGFVMAGVNPILSAVGFERVPAELQARVMGLTRAVSWAGLPLGGLAGGLAVAGFGLTPALLLAGGLYIGVTLVPLVAPVWRGAPDGCGVVAPAAQRPGRSAPRGPR